MFKRYYLCLDVGGTEIKVNILNKQKQPFYTENICYESKARLDQHSILQHFKTIITEHLQIMNENGAQLLGIGVAFPGPFDYENGISLMRGIRKYDAIYQVNLKECIRQWIIKLGFQTTTPIIFENDATSFAKGEYYYGVAKGQNKAMFITLGTGCGSTFMEDQRIVKNKYGLNEAGMVYDTPFLGGTMDECLSAKGLMEIAKANNVTNVDGYHLFVAAENRDVRAQRVFSQFGTQIAQGLRPFMLSFAPDILVFGGQISQSLKWMINSMQEQLTKSGIIPPHICASRNTSLATLTGLVQTLEKIQEC
ncbi:ROK family protein [Lederbergia lenta]|uniref:ROK family protein n=1 Tax=Lederbergia lenta TaxID=1467 RepID=A0A2X4W842_LEDLE|nr:ROK family protein [Lederbergia lenta]